MVIMQDVAMINHVISVYLFFDFSKDTWFCLSDNLFICSEEYRSNENVTNDYVLFVSDWSTLVVAKLSPWLQTDSAVDTVRRNSEEVSDMCSALGYIISTGIHSSWVAGCISWHCSCL